MKLKRFKVPIYGYKVTYIEVEHEIDHIPIKRILMKLPGINKQDVESTIYSIKNNPRGGEHTYTIDTGESIIIVFGYKTKLDHISTLCHEKRHLEDRIMEYYHIKDRESAAYIAGWLGEKLLKHII